MQTREGYCVAVHPPTSCSSSLAPSAGRKSCYFIHLFDISMSKKIYIYLFICSLFCLRLAGSSAYFFMKINLFNVAGISGKQEKFLFSVGKSIFHRLWHLQLYIIACSYFLRAPYQAPSRKNLYASSV